MLNDSEKEMIESQFQKLSQATLEREKAEERIQRHEAAIRGLLALVENEHELRNYLERLDRVIKPSGITDAVRDVLQRATGPLTPTEIKDALSTTGFDVSGYSNPLASIHTILKRLVEADTAEARFRSGKIAYCWKGVRRFRRNRKKLRTFVGSK